LIRGSCERRFIPWSANLSGRFNHAKPWSSTNRAGLQAAAADPER
jgi:hypothetical protein